MAKKVSGSQEVPVMGEIWRNHGEAGCYWMLMMLIVGCWMLLVLTWDVSFLDMFGTLDVRPRLRPDSGKCSWVVWHEPRLLRAKILLKSRHCHPVPLMVEP